MSTYWINVTDNCNLNCAYCYQTIREKNNMTEETADKIISSIDSAKEETNNILFFGGEPMLNFNIIKYISGEIKKRNINARYAWTSNLVLLTDEMIDFITDKGVAVSVSIDGKEETYNRNRFSGNNKKVFDTVINNLNRLKATEYENIRILKVLAVNNYKSAYEDILFLDSFGFNIQLNLDMNIADKPADRPGATETIDPKIYKQEFKKILLHFYKNRSKSFTYLNHVIDTFKYLFYDKNSAEREASFKCTTPDNIIMSFDTHGNVSPCHFINELSYTELRPFVYTDSSSLKNELTTNPCFFDLSEAEKLNRIQTDIQTKNCRDCKYIYACIDSSLGYIDNYCYMKRLRYRTGLDFHSLEHNQRAGALCMTKLMNDLMFECINEGGIDLNAILQ